MSVSVREVRSEEDCKAVVELTADAFPAELSSTQMSPHKWRELHLDDWLRQPWLWKHVGVACDGDKIIGTVVLTIDDEADGSLSYWQISQRVGCLPTLCTIAYDNVLEEPLKPHEALIDFIAVSPEARGKGVGSKLLEWAEHTARIILADRATEEVRANGVQMSLWVANSNVNARRLYEKAGYIIKKSTSESTFHCFSACILRRFLGDSVWHKMEKALSPPEYLLKTSKMASKVPQGATMVVPVMASAGGGGKTKATPATPVNIVTCLVP